MQSSLNKQLLYGPAAQAHFEDHFKAELKDIQGIKMHLDPDDGRKVDELRNQLGFYVEKAAKKVDSVKI